MTQGPSHDSQRDMGLWTLSVEFVKSPMPPNGEGIARVLLLIFSTNTIRKSIKFPKANQVEFSALL